MDTWRDPYVVLENTVRLIQNLSECDKPWRVRDIQDSLADSVHVGYLFT
jgi:hypothetical protein